ncbi:PP2C family serine/threonine-protein phosphatase [Streptomyces sp. NBC_00038]|uniref:PP2C family serine/threonine-protein phosphatase n=1 Tax=Streptomyces sp. NBC_00038 TaxID=2903615 RepID=UPI00224F7A35|nr:PP2C family serine/threonine-protein phosphatase [Streptomyces sp. NBC_00038]MCX5562233.1 protein phosphatase 2C domain-containing protein [Streptomyces sp. NBC_00038]
MVTVPGAAEATGLSSGDHWRIHCEHVMGPHKKNYQDDASAELVPGRDAAVLAVADGHGSAAHAYSHVGAQYAVKIFIRLGKEFAERALRSLPLPRLKADAEDRMPRELVRSWQHEVLEHARRKAGGPDSTPPAAEGVRQQDLVPYGTTLIGAVITPGLLVGWQLGDGELAVVDPRGKIRLPLDSGLPELGDETDSLCSRQAWDLMRVHWSPITAADSSPALVLLSTDGLSKSFVDRQGFQDFVRGTYERLREQGPSAVADDLPKWLAQAAKYSGDDTTVAAAWRAATGPSGTSASTWTGTEEE